MGALTGLKGLFKKPLYLFIITYFILIWFLILIERYLLSNLMLRLTTIVFGGGLILFNITLFIISFFTSITTLNKWILILIFSISHVVAFIFTENIFLPTFQLFFIITLNANIFFTVFFAFKICMDYSTKLDDYISKKEKYRIFLRATEFIMFGIIYIFIVAFIRIFIARNLNPIAQVFSLILCLILWTNFLLIGVIVLRAVLKKRFAAYITFFFILTFFYTLYIIFDYLYGLLASSGDQDAIYIIFSFILDLALFLYILGTIFDRIEYLKSKLKVFRVDTILVFLVVMRLYVQISKISPGDDLSDFLFLQEGGLLIIFMFSL
jgi:hypothetical protein